MNEVQPLLTLLDAAAASTLLDVAENTVLGVQQIGEAAARVPGHAPTQTLAAPILLSDANQLCDIWLTNSPCRSEQLGNVRIRSSDHMLFGVIEIDAAPDTQGGEYSALRAATEAVYREIFETLDARNFPHLWRIWNYIPDIHGDEAGLERYRQFNVGRQQAFDAARRPIDASPAASALGTRGGLFSVAFIAGRVAPRRIENPRQISAYDYPPQYGPRSPAFARAAIVGDAHHHMLFVSGTASIVGHETVHTDDVAAQTCESIANIAALLEQANAALRPALALQDLTYRVYIRHPQHAPLVRQVLNARLTAPARALYVQADICRTDLLVEIEAFATAPTTQRS